MNNGTVIVLYSAFQGYWTYEIQPTDAWIAQNRTSHYECAFAPYDTKAEALEAAREVAKINGMRVLH